MPDLPSHCATRYVQPLREGGSLPAIVDTDGGGLFVVKFRGAGQGTKVLVAELIVGMLARSLGLPVPELAVIEVPPLFGRMEPDPEIQDILKNSHGPNVGLRYLDGAFNFDAYAAGELATPEFAAAMVWFDAYVTNPDRTHRNPNLLVWDGRLWLIDHGAALYAHHNWPTVDDVRARTSFPLIRDHILLDRSGDLEAADARLGDAITDRLLADTLAAVPDALLAGPLSRSDFPTAADARARYHEYLRARIQPPRAFAAEALRAREERRHAAPGRLSARR